MPARALLLPLAVSLTIGSAGARPDPFPALPAGTQAGWTRYVLLTEQRIQREVTQTRGFLALDFTPSATADRRSALTGGLPVAPMETTTASGDVIDVPGGWVHHWRGAVLIPGASLDGVFSRLQQRVPGTGRGNVIASAILSRDGPNLRVFIKVRRSGRFILAYTIVYNTEHDVRFVRRDATHGTSTSVATKIAEVDQPGSPQEREYGQGEDHEFLQRWNSYWRYEQVPAGVIAECESITLSRTAPYGTGWAVRSFADAAASEAMRVALVSLRDDLSVPAETPPSSWPVR